jgi:hypothetical protein
MTDSFSNLVHRPTIDQFTEGVASKRSSPALTLVAPGPGRGGKRGREERKVIHSSVPKEAVLQPNAWPLAFGGRLSTGEAQPPNITS